MFCDECQANEATVHYTEIVENKIIKINLCKKCAEQKGIDIDDQFLIGDFLSGLTQNKETKLIDEKTTCPDCGLSLAEFKKTGRLGCATCYKTFEKVLEVLLNSIHKNTQHIGKKTKIKKKKVLQEEKTIQLKKLLNDAIKNENFEEAAKLRDEIKRLSKEKG